MERDRDRDRPPWLARLHDDRGAVQGAGVLIDDDRVLTCAHVVAACAGDARLARREDRPQAVVHVEFPFAGGGQAAAGVAAEGWVRVAPDESGDIAVLRLDRPVPGARPAPMRRPSQLNGHRFSMHGFPPTTAAEPAVLNAAARTARGTIGPFTGPSLQWAELFVPEGRPVDYGFSGAPVWDERLQAVVGICVMRDEYRTAHMLPLAGICESWPWLADLARWRLARDAPPGDLRHWRSSARGLEPAAAAGTADWLFSGRGRELTTLTACLTDPDAPPLAVVTGAPGTGKSALLGFLLLVTGSPAGETVPDVPGWDNRANLRPDVFDVAIRVAGLESRQVAERLAAAAGIDPDVTDAESLVREFRDRGQPFTALLDGIDEARTPADAKGIAALLRSLASYGRDGRPPCRLIASVRNGPPGSELARLLEMFGANRVILDLSSAHSHDEPAVVAYATRLLLWDPPGRRSPYHEVNAAGLANLARAIARREESNFLFTQLTCRWLAGLPAPVGAGEIELPHDVADALDRYLNACELRTSGVRDLLRPLAFARGNGIPRGQLWVDLAQALARGSRYTSQDLDAVFDSAAAYLVDRGGDSEPSYRLFHRALDEHLRASAPGTGTETAITRSLLRHVPSRDGRRDWQQADPYIRAHLAEHATAAGLLDDLMSDAGFLVHGDPRALLPGLDTVTAPDARLAAAIYRSSMHLHAGAGISARRLILALDSARWGVPGLTADLNRLDIGDSFPWEVRYATGSMVSPALKATISGHARIGRNGDVTALAAGQLDGTLIAVTGGNDGLIRVWDLRRATQIGLPMAGSTYVDGIPGAVEAVAIGDLGGAPVAVTAGADGSVRIWDLRRRSQLGGPMIGDTGTSRDRGVTSVATGDLDGTPIAVTGARDGTVRIWDLGRREQAGPPMITYRDPRDERVVSLRDGVISVALANVDGRPVAVAGGADICIRVWDLRSHEQIGELRADPAAGERFGAAEVLAVADHHGTPLVIAGEAGGMMRRWNLRTMTQAGAAVRVIDADRSGVSGMAVTDAGDTQVIVTAGGHDAIVRIWDLNGEPAGTLTGHSPGVMSLAATRADGIPLVVSAGLDGTIRLWDLNGDVSGPERLIAHGYSVNAVAVDDTDGETVAVTGDGSGAVCTWRESVSGLRCQREHAHEKWVTSAAIAPVGGSRIAITSGFEGKAMFTDLDGAGPDLPAELGAAIRSMPIPAAAGTALAVESEGGLARWMWIPYTHFDPADDDQDDAPAAAVCDVDGTPVLVTGSGHGFVRFWDLTSGEPLTDPVRAHHEVSAVAAGELDGMPVAITAGWEGSLLLWDPRTRTPVGQPLTGHDSRVRALTIGALGGAPVAVSGDEDGALVVWDLRRRAPVAAVTLPADVRSLALSAGGTVVAGMGGEVVVLGYRHSGVPPPITLTARGRDGLGNTTALAMALAEWSFERGIPLPDWFLQDARKADAESPLTAREEPAGTASDDDAERRRWQLAADAGDGAAMFNLSVIQFREGDTREALRWMEAAAEQGEQAAMRTLAQWCEDHEDQEQAVRWWERAAEAGSPEAMFSLAALEADRGDLRGAWRRSHQAAQRGSVRAAVMIGWTCDLAGASDLAAHWYLGAALRGDVEGMCCLGGFFAKRLLFDDAERWWESAARRGHVKSMFLLGVQCHNTGDDRKANVWWDRAEKTTDRDDLAALAELHRQHGDLSRVRAINRRLTADEWGTGTAPR